MVMAARWATRRQRSRRSRRARRCGALVLAASIDASAALDRRLEIDEVDDERGDRNEDRERHREAELLLPAAHAFFAGGDDAVVGGFGAGGDVLERKLMHELADGLVGIESDLLRVRADERAREDPARQLLDFVVLERLERAQRDARSGGDLTQRHAALLTRFTKVSAEVHGQPDDDCTIGERPNASVTTLCSLTDTSAAACAETAELARLQRYRGRAAAKLLRIDATSADWLSRNKSDRRDTGRARGGNAIDVLPRDAANRRESAPGTPRRRPEAPPVRRADALQASTCVGNIVPKMR